MSDLFCDLHIHTKFSCDSTVDLETYCLKAIREGAGIICFTDHVDSNPADDGYGYYDVNNYFNVFNKVKEKYGNKLTLLSGIEFGDTHMYQDILAEYALYDYDYIVATVHFWYENMYPSAMVSSGIPVDICYERYWDEILKTVKAGGFDCLGHMDFPKRYYRQLVFDPEKISGIFKEMISKDISLEINTSTLRQNLSVAMPDKEILSIYYDCGGRHITIGSDAHRVEDIFSGRQYAKQLINYFGFDEVYYYKRELIILKK